MIASAQLACASTLLVSQSGRFIVAWFELIEGKLINLVLKYKHTNDCCWARSRVGVTAINLGGSQRTPKHFQSMLFEDCHTVVRLRSHRYHLLFGSGFGNLHPLYKDRNQFTKKLEPDQDRVELSSQRDAHAVQRGEPLWEYQFVQSAKQHLQQLTSKANCLSPFGNPNATWVQDTFCNCCSWPCSPLLSLVLCSGSGDRLLLLLLPVPRPKSARLNHEQVKIAKTVMDISVFCHVYLSKVKTVIRSFDFYHITVFTQLYRFWPFYPFATLMNRFSLKSKTYFMYHVVLTHISGVLFNNFNNYKNFNNSFLYQVTYYLSSTINPILYQLMSRKLYRFS